jgi:sigma-B regulation protein RsbU (phosphoserine phosphatase)
MTSPDDRSSPQAPSRRAGDQPQILLATPGSPASAAGWWAERVGPVWPAGEARPAVRGVRLSDLNERMDVRLLVERSCAVLLLADAPADLPGLMRAAAVIREAGRTGVALLHAPSEAARARLEQAGLMVQDRTACERTLAGVLCGLARAARTLRDLEGELAVASRLQAGARAWIRRVDEELHVAARMQRDLLPRRMPEVGPFRFAALFKPLWHVSGDIYQVQRLDEHHLGFMIADAMGHGVRAAMAAMILAHGLVMKDITPDGYSILHPAEALARLNAEMLRHPSQAMRFASALCGVLDTRDGTLDLSGAGHPHPLLLADGNTRRVELDGPLLGVFDDARFKRVRLTLAPGEALAVYTDGLEAALGAGRSVTDQLTPDATFCSGIARALTPDQPLDDALMALSLAIDSRAGSLHRADDVTVLALRHDRPAASGTLPWPAAA